MNLDNSRIDGSFRISPGRMTTKKDIKKFTMFRKNSSRKLKQKNKKIKEQLKI